MREAFREILPIRATGGPAPGDQPPSGCPLTRKQIWMLGLVAGILTLLYGMNFSAIQVIPGARSAGMFWVYPLFVALVFLVYLVGVRLTWAAGRRVALVVIALGVAFRLCMLPTQVVLSTDLYRYFWDGRVQLSGINPYRYPPEAQVLADLRDARIYPRINRAWAPTIYPPGAQMLFAALELAAPDRIWALRAVLIACELTTMLLLVVLLRRLGLPQGRVAVYAWAPLPIFEFAQAGHIDAALVPLVLGALLAAGRGLPGVAGGLLGGAALIKLYPAALLPVLWRRRDARLPLAFLATVALGYLPYAWGVGWKVMGFLPTYFAPFEEFNVGLRALLTDGVGITGIPARLVVSALLAVLLVAVLLTLGLIRGDTPRDLASACGGAVGAFLLLVPSTIHPWYVVWLIPFLVVLPAPGWWYLSVAVVLSYVAYAGGPVVVPGWVRAVEYLPAYFGVLLGFCRAHWRPAEASPRSGGEAAARSPFAERGRPS